MIRGNLITLAESASVRREYCRRLFRVGGATAALRNAFLDGLSDAAIEAQQSGSAVLSTSKNGAAVQFQYFAGWTPAATLEYVDEARAWAACLTVEAALALINRGGSFVLSDFSNANATGGCL